MYITFVYYVHVKAAQEYIDTKSQVQWLRKTHRQTFNQYKNVRVWMPSLENWEWCV